MKKFKIPIILFTFILLVVFMFLITRRFELWNKIYVSYSILAVGVLLYLIIMRRGAPLKSYCIHTFFGIIIAVLLSGIVSGVSLIGIVWLLLYGVITGLLVATIVYHAVHLFVLHAASERGFPYFAEISITFFACATYPVLVYVPFTLIDALILIIVLFAVSVLIGFALTIPLNRSLQMILNSVKNWQALDDFPSAHNTMVENINRLLSSIFGSVKKTLHEISSTGSKIKTSTEDFSSTSEQINASLQEVSSTIQNISKGTQEQSASIMTMVRSIEELYDLTKSISTQVKDATESSQKTTDSAKQGMEFSRKEATITKEIFNQTRFIEDKMAELRDQANEIKKILDIIGSIAEQTDLLALNAAIEAARVGQQGRGFAVVSDEIRNLATETQHSSAVVENLISEINNTIQELNNLLASEREKINESNELAAQTEQQFTSIAKAVDLVTGMITQINEAAAAQSEKTKEFVTQVEQIAQVATDNAAATEEVSASVQEQTASMQQFTSTVQILTSIAAKLDELLIDFKK
ncbi:MAG: hypothetical protein JSV97_06665 [candidate division WOR-3 bacterium]|nr:MAG: hypothetical protein JSV97_06665 [candidate division WOR-3 bacterium]